MPFLDDLLRLEAEGAYTRLEVFAEIFCHLDDRNVEHVIDDLPAPVRLGFIAWARKNYDNSVPPGDFIYIGGEGGSPVPDRAFDAIRRWLSANRTALS
jgi:hypothetical protein